MVVVLAERGGGGVLQGLDCSKKLDLKSIEHLLDGAAACPQKNARCPSRFLGQPSGAVPPDVLRVEFN